MNFDSPNDFDEGINEILHLTKDNELKEIIIDTVKKYAGIDSKFNLKTAVEVFESLKWVAEQRKDSDSVRNAIECFLMKSVIETILKYHGDVSNEVFNNIIWKIEEYLNKETVQKYINWVNNGHVSKLLNFAEELNGNGNIKIKNDIFSIINVKESGLEKFDFYADKISNKKLFLENKIELFSILRDIVNKNKDEYAEILVTKGIKELSRRVEVDLNKIKCLDNISLLKCAIKFVEDMKRDENAEFLFQKCKEFKNVGKWLVNDEITKNTLKKMKELGFDTDLYVSSGKVIMQKRVDGHFSENWSNALKLIVIKIVGSKKNKTLPKIGVPKMTPGSIFKKIKSHYFDAMNQDKNAAQKLLKELKELIQKSYSGKRIPRSVNEILNDISSLEKVLLYGGIATFRGAKVIAKVWKRRIPEDLYDSEKLHCCLFLPEGEKGEMPLFMMDPKTTLLQYYVQGLHDPVSIVFIYAGIHENEPALFVDTWEGGAFVYSALGQDKMKEFVYKSVLKFSEKVGAKSVIFYAKPNYGRSKEFCSYLRDIGLKSKKISFEAVDAEDSVIKAYSKCKKHHYTDAFGSSSIKGKVEAFLVKI